MALTEKYVSSLAGGGGAGTSGSPYTFSEMVTLINSASGAGAVGMRFNIKADGTYTRGGTDEMFGASGTNASPIVMRGYKTAIGDGYLGRDSTGNLITTNMPLISMNDGTFAIPNWCVVESLQITSSNRNDWTMKIRKNSSVIGCKVTNGHTGTDASCAEVIDFTLLWESDFAITSSGSTRCVIELRANAGRLDSCRIISSSSTADGVRVDWQCHFYGCLIKGAGGARGINFSDINRDANVRNCTIIGWQDGIRLEVPTQLVSFIAGNMITDNAGYGINLPSTSMVILAQNRLRDNTSGNINNSTGDWVSAGRILPLTTTGAGTTDYVSPGTNDYNLVPTSPGKGVNRPLTSDMGPYGLPDPAGGGGSAVFNPLAQTIIRPA